VTVTLPETIDFEACQAMDRDDPLASMRDRFAIDDGVVYLDGNSLGRLPAETPRRVNELVKTEWGEGLIRSWLDAHWMESPQRVGDKIARMLGAEHDEVLVTDTTSVDIFKLVTAVMHSRPQRKMILTETENFPTDLYVSRGVATLLDHAREVRTVERSRLVDSLDADVALLMLTHIDYRSGDAHDMPALTAAAHDAGALVLWDLSHSAGAVPVRLAASDVDLAVGCGYKYLNGGPGAPAYLFVARRLQNELTNPIQGWLGHDNPFLFESDYRRSPGIRSWLSGSPPVMATAALEVSIDLFLEADMTRVGAKSAALTELFIRLADQRLAGYGFSVATQRDVSRRGAQVSLRHHHGYRVIRALIDRGVIGDFRPPDLCRFGFAPLYTRYVDVWLAVDIMSEVMESGVYRSDAYAERAYIT
jgi:kynureninase